MILSAQSIRSNKLIYPMEEKTIFEGMSYGLSSAGYDVRVEFDSEGTVKDKVLFPGDFILASTIEQFCIPDSIVGIVHDKSSWARRGLAVQNTVIEPGWEGYLTLELTNHSKQIIYLTRGMPIAQIIFHWLDSPTESPYEGKYQNQIRGPVEAIKQKV